MMYQEKKILLITTVTTIFILFISHSLVDCPAACTISSCALSYKLYKLFVFRKMSFTLVAINVRPIISSIFLVQFCCRCLIIPVCHLIAGFSHRDSQDFRVALLILATWRTNARKPRARACSYEEPSTISQFLGYAGIWWIVVLIP